MQVLAWIVLGCICALVVTGLRETSNWRSEAFFAICLVVTVICAFALAIMVIGGGK